MTSDSPRWRDYFLRKGEGFNEFWAAFLADKERDLLFIVGHGFDARMCEGLERILELGGVGKRDVALLAFEEGEESSSRSYLRERDANEERLREAIEGRGVIERRDIKMFSDNDRRIGARSIASEFSSFAEFSPYTDVIVDVSALPRSLYMPLLAKLLSIFDSEPDGGGRRNLHVIVSHSPVIDTSIVEVGLEDSAAYLFGFAAAALESESTIAQPTIWMPVLGRGQQVQLQLINQFVTPDEICPLLPSPALDPREGDSIVVEYQELLFDQLRVEPRNIIYAAEANPFEVYRQLMRSIIHYQRALQPLGGSKVALSAMSSKLASIGVLLAAYELGRWTPRVAVGVAHVETQGYRIEPTCSHRPTTLFTMWLSGECYAA